MKILIVSDTHGRHSAFDKALKEAGKIDALVHLGDTEGGEDYIEAVCGCPAYVLAGNNDFFSDNLREMEVVFGTKKAFMTHGHYYYVSLGPERIIEEGIMRNADIVMFGHTHRPVIEVEQDITLINPGSISYPRQADGIPTYIMLEIDDNNEFYFTLKNV